MKESFYNNYIEFDNQACLIYNSFADSYLLLNKDLYQTFTKHKKNLNWIKNNNINLYKLLVENHIIVEKKVDEISLVYNKRIKQRFSSYHYELMINPTLDCNLNCWYCYETHIQNSKMSDDIKNRIIKHLNYKYTTTPFKALTVSFFGGEPLLRAKSVVIPLIKDISDFSNKNKISLMYNFTTNGTIITYDFLKSLEDIYTKFQITIDGNKDSHNKIRVFKNKKNVDSYSIIINNLKKITETVKKYNITIRINYDDTNIKNAYKIIDDLEFLPKSKIKFLLVKIWQADNKQIKSDDITNLTKKLLKAGYFVDNIDLNPKNYVCYADNYNQVLINYDGNVFKCTARNFTKNNSEGFLDENGIIVWNTKKLVKRLFLEIPNVCKKCKLLPSCPGICSQTIIEKGVNTDFCIVKNKGQTIEEFVFNNFEKKFNDEY